MQSWLTPPLVISLLALIVGIISLSYTRKRDQQQDWKEDNERLEEEITEACGRISEIEGDLKVLNKQMNLFWKTVEQQMAKKFQDGE